MLEPCDAKVSRTVLRGLGDRKVARLLGKLSCTVLRGLDGSNPVRLLGQWAANANEASNFTQPGFWPAPTEVTSTGGHFTGLWLIIRAY